MSLIERAAGLLGPSRGPAVALAGLMLWPSAFVTDVGLRSSGQLRWLALSQTFRAVGYALAVLGLVHGPGDVLRAAGHLGRLAQQHRQRQVDGAPGQHRIVDAQQAVVGQHRVAAAQLLGDRHVGPLGQRGLLPVGDGRRDDVAVIRFSGEDVFHWLGRERLQ